MQWRQIGGLFAGKKVLDFEEIVGREFGEFGIVGDQGFEDILLVVEVLVNLSKSGQALRGHSG